MGIDCKRRKKTQSNPGTARNTRGTGNRNKSENLIIGAVQFTSGLHICRSIQLYVPSTFTLINIQKIYYTHGKRFYCTRIV